jgi:2-amino-4-hydroxy-6-hydroxymethyldihydropteridine diphosphokinase
LPQPPFLNAAVRGTTQLPPHELLRQLKGIEAELGRTVGGQVRPAPLAGCLSGVRP